VKKRKYNELLHEDIQIEMDKEASLSPHFKIELKGASERVRIVTCSSPGNDNW
jgi:hypothetical protein